MVSDLQATTPPSGLYSQASFPSGFFKTLPLTSIFKSSFIMGSWVCLGFSYLGLCVCDVRPWGSLPQPSVYPSLPSSPETLLQEAQPSLCPTSLRLRSSCSANHCVVQIDRLLLITPKSISSVLCHPHSPTELPTTFLYLLFANSIFSLGFLLFCCY